jgi:hypothetical protein
MKAIKTLGWALITLFVYGSITFMLMSYLLSDTISGVKIWQ